MAYGYSACVLQVLGIPFCLPVMHGKTRRGALVFDLADVVKDGLVIPSAFKNGSSFLSDQRFRNDIVQVALNYGVMDKMIDIIKDTLNNVV